MKQYISKSALVAEINRVFNSYDPNEITSGRYALVSLRNFIDTLEVKEVNLEKEIPMWIKENPRESPFDDGWFIGMDDCLHRNGYKIKICDLWNLPKEPFNSKEFGTI